MSEALERVIAEQQTKIDQLTAEVTRGHETLNMRCQELEQDLQESANAELTGAPLGAPGARRPFARPVE